MTKLLTFLVLIFFLSDCTPEDTGKTARKLPNIVLLVADDAGYGDFGCYGQEIFQTPNVDQLSREGMLFTQLYAGSTVCAPSRSSLMTGLHTGHTFIRGNKEVKPEGQYPIPSEIKLLPEYLKDAGYVTGGFGKWGLGFPGSEGDPVNHGIDEFFGYNCQRLAHNYFPEYLWHNSDTVFLHQNDNGAEGAYSADLIQDEALKFIESHREEPFFLFLPYTLPHAELLVPDDSIFQKFKGRFPETPYRGVDEGEGFRTGAYGSQIYPHAAFASMITRLDLYVGELMNKLKESGLEDNTIFIFTSDNGPHKEGGADPDFFDSNGPFKGYKRDLYEGGIRVPFIVRWPGKIKPGSESNHIAAFWDILPTLCEITGMDMPDKTDGISMLPAWTGAGTQQQHQYMYWEFYEQGGRQAVRMGNWKGIRQNVKENPNGPVELYNLMIDPGEEKNLAIERPDVVNELENIMKEAHTPSEVFQF